MPLDSEPHEPRTNAEQSEIAADFRGSFESLIAGPRFHYTEHQVHPPADGEPSFLREMPIDELRALLRTLVNYTGICSHWTWPLPPRGLPGFLHSPYSKDDPEAELLELGIRYVHAIVNNERRSMHKRWEDASEFIHKIEQKVGERIQKRLADRHMKQDMAEAKVRAAANRVYFIGSASGPIKIGKARNTKKRLKALQTSHHEKLTILATCRGGDEVEKAYHVRFSDYRLNGEWFERCPEIEAEIARLTP